MKGGKPCKGSTKDGPPPGAGKVERVSRRRLGAKGGRETRGRGVSCVAKRIAGLAMSVVLALSTLLGLMPAGAFAAATSGTVSVDAVPENEFEPYGYSDSIDFTDIQIERGFQYHDMIGKFYFGSRTHDPSKPTGDPNDCLGQAMRSDGWAAPIDASTPKGSFALRYKGGTYGKDRYDAIVTLKDWTYLEPIDGWDTWWEVDKPQQFQTGVYVMKNMEVSGEGRGINNFNIYTVGLSEVDVDVQFVYADTNNPFPVKGHLTCIDLDWGQTFSFGGSIFAGRIVNDNSNLSLEDLPTGGQLVRSSEGLSMDWAKSPEEYRKGLVSTYYDTTNEQPNGKGGVPLEFHFGTSWQGSDRAGTAESIFALSSEFLTMPDPSEPPSGETPVPTKTADKTSGVSISDEVTYTIEMTAHEQGVNCRGGYRYSNLDILDYLPAEMRYVDGSGYLTDEAGNVLSGAGHVIYEGNNEDPTENTVRFEFDSKFLKTMKMMGEKYRFVLKARLTEYPANGQRDADGDLYIRNGAAVRYNNGGDIDANFVDTKLVEPKFSVDKVADTYEYEVADIISYTVTYRQTEKNAQSRETVISDNLPEGLELIADSVRATGIKDLPEPVINGNMWSYTFDKFNYGDTITVTYQARALNGGNGTEIVNNASIHANNAMDADDPAEVWTNTADVEITKEADRYEGYVGASDRDPGFFEYTVRATNTKEGTIANGVVITDESLPEGMKVGRNNDGSMTVEVEADDGSDAKMAWNGSEASGSFSSIEYPVGKEDDIHDQTESTPVTWFLEPLGTGWRLHVDHLDEGVTVTIRYRAYPEDSVSGWEIHNKAEVSADNALPEEDRAKVWVNQPHLVVDKQASTKSLTVGDTILYHVKVTNATPGTLGRNLVVSDLARTKGVELLRDSIRVYDSKGDDITGSCTLTTRHGQETFIVETHRNIVNGSGKRPVWQDGKVEDVEGENPLGEGGETSITVEYQVYIADASLAGSTVDNTAYAGTDEPNTGTTDDEVIEVKGARLTVEKSSDKQAYEVGETGHYTLVVRQTREDNVAKNVYVKDLMDVQGLGEIVEGSVVAVGPDGATVGVAPEYLRSEGGAIVGFTLATGLDLADEEEITITYDVRMNAPGEVLGNKAQASADNATGGVDDNEVEIVGPRATVAFEKRVDRETARVGDTVTYELVASIADNPAHDVTLSDVSLPAGMPVDLRGIELEVNGTDVEDFGMDVKGNGFVVRLGSLGVGDVVKVTYKAEVRDEKLAGISVVNTALLDSSSLDEPLRDDAHVTILEDEPAVSFKKSVDRQSVRVGETAIYTLEGSVADDAERGAENVVVRDASLPVGMPIDMASIRAWRNDREITPVKAAIDGNAFSIAFGDLAAGDKVSVTYAAKVADAALAGTSVTNTATLDSDTLDEPLEDRAVIEVPKEGETTVDKQADRRRAKPGDTIAYTVTAVAGTDLADAVLTDEGLPAGVRVNEDTLELEVNGKQAKVEVERDGTGFALRLGDLAAGDAVVVRYKATVAEGYVGVAENTATLTSPSLDEPVSDDERVRVPKAEDPCPGEEPDDPTPEPEPDEPTPEDPREEPETPEAHTDVSKTVSNARPTSGERVTYVISVAARGGDLTNLKVFDTPEDGIEILEDSLAVTVDGEPVGRATIAVGEDGTLSCLIGTLPEGSVARLAYEAVIDRAGEHAGEDLVNVATATSDETDPTRAKALVTLGQEGDEPKDKPEPDAPDPETPAPDGGADDQGGGKQGTGKRLSQTASGVLPIVLTVVGGVLVAGAGIAWHRLRK